MIVAEAQRRANRAHRERTKRRGLVRVEVRVDAVDGALLREVAGRLRDDADAAGRLREDLRRLLAGSAERTLLDDLACDLPDELVDEALARPCDVGRKVDL